MAGKFDKFTGQFRENDVSKAAVEAVLTGNISSHSHASNDKGYFLTEAALIAAYPVGQAGWYAIVGETDTIWIWDTDTEAWVNSGASSGGSELPVVTLGTSGTVTIDRSVSDKFIIPPPTGALTLADANFADMKEAVIDINKGYGNVSFPADWNWVDGILPELTNAGVNRIKLTELTSDSVSKINAKNVSYYPSFPGNAEYTKALVHFDGIDGSTSITNNASGSDQILTLYDNAELDTSDKVFGTSSLLVTNGGGVITPSDDDFTFGSGDFSIEVRWKRIASETMTIFDIGGLYSSNVMLRLNINNSLYLYIDGDAANTPVISPSGYDHYLLIRNGNYFKVFFNGSRIINRLHDYNVLGDYILMGNSDSSYSYSMDELRIVKGKDVTTDPDDLCYSADGETFTVPQQAYEGV